MGGSQELTEAKHLTPKAASIASKARPLVQQLLKDVEHDPGCVATAAQNAGKILYGQCLTASAGRKDDVKQTLQVVRDEIGRVYFTGEKARRERQIEVLFMLFDEVEWRSAEGVATCDQQAALVFEELRSRFNRLLVGDKWETAPKLRLKALKRIYAYQEHERRQTRGPGLVQRSASSNSGGSCEDAAAGRGLARKLSRRLSGGGVSVGTWADLLEEFGRAPPAKLFPLMRLLLAEKGPVPVSNGTPYPEPEEEEEEGGKEGHTPRQDHDQGTQQAGGIGTVAEENKEGSEVDLLNLDLADDLPPSRPLPPSNSDANGDARGYATAFADNNHAATGANAPWGTPVPVPPPVHVGHHAGVVMVGFAAQSPSQGVMLPPALHLPPVTTLSVPTPLTQWSSQELVGRIPSGHSHPGYYSPHSHGPVSDRRDSAGDYDPFGPHHGKGKGQWKYGQQQPNRIREGDSPYLGKQQPLKDNTFADLSPICPKP